MNTKLNHVQNWSKLAQKTNWSVKGLADYCDVSSRTLERYFIKQMGQTPKKWLANQRYLEAEKKIRTGLSIKETAHAVGYKHSSTFAREFKKLSGKFPNFFGFDLPGTQKEPEAGRNVV